MRLRFRPAFCCFFILAGAPAFAQEAPPAWNAPKPVDENTVFFGEPPREEIDASRIKPGDKGYAWYWLDKGNSFLLAQKAENAASAFAKAYSDGGTTRVLSGFKLVETYESLGRLEAAVAVLEEMRKKYLVSNEEFGRAQLIRQRLEDQIRQNAAVPPPPAFDGRQWLLQTQTERMKYVVDAAGTLRGHGVPLKDWPQRYVFLLDEYFIVHPEESAENGAEVLARLVYETDRETRIPIDRWRINPDATQIAEQAPEGDGRNRFTGAEWTVLTHEYKMQYVSGAMEMLKNQQVPMQKTAYAYEYEVDQLFTDKPELDATDSVVTLASVLYDTEPEAHEVLEALRLK